MEGKDFTVTSLYTSSRPGRIVITMESADGDKIELSTDAQSPRLGDKIWLSFIMPENK